MLEFAKIETRDGADAVEVCEILPTEPHLELLVELPSRREVFLNNLRDLINPPRLPELHLRSAPAPFWHDVFVKRGLPWIGFLESAAYHVIFCALLLAVSRFMALRPTAVLRPAFDHTQVIYYNASEYLPPVDTRRTPRSSPAKADPEFARQTIISVPPEADNRSQTIVTPPKVRLNHDVRMPNIVAWSDHVQKPQLEIPPAPLTPAAEITRLTPRIENSVVAPPPDAAHLQHRSQNSLQTAVVAPPPELAHSREQAGVMQAPQPAVVAPPPVVDNAPTRQLGEINIGRSQVIAPAPQLPMAEQRAVNPGRPGVGAMPEVVPPPPSMAALDSANRGSPGKGSTMESGSPGRVIALNVHPAVDAPPAAPSGNRRGEFAAAPEGHTGAAGTMGTSSGTAAGANGSGNAAGSAAGSNRKANSDLPAGLYVGNPAAAVKTSPVVGKSSSTTASIAGSAPATSATTPKGSGIPARVVPAESVAHLSEPERAVFGIRKLYALNVNLPNLNSSGGSWIIRFAELNQDPSAPATANITQPVAIKMVDPGYPSQLIRENVSGTVIVYGVIHADGSVSNVRVLRGVDDRLDRYACNALAQWKFQPATKNDTAIDVEATFQIPFKPPRLGTSF